MRLRIDGPDKVGMGNIYIYENLFESSPYIGDHGGCGDAHY